MDNRIKAAVLFNKDCLIFDAENGVLQYIITANISQEENIRTLIIDLVITKSNRYAYLDFEEIFKISTKYFPQTCSVLDKDCVNSDICLKFYKNIILDKAVPDITDIYNIADNKEIEIVDNFLKHIVDKIYKFISVNYKHSPSYATDITSVHSIGNNIRYLNDIEELPSSSCHDTKTAIEDPAFAKVDIDRLKKIDSYNNKTNIVSDDSDRNTVSRDPMNIGVKIAKL